MSSDGGVSVSQSTLFSNNSNINTSSITTDNSALAWQSAGSYDNDKETYVLISLLCGLFFVPAWIMIILSSISDYNKPSDKKSINWSKLLWWQWMFLVIAPLLVFLTKGLQNNQESGKQYASSVFSQQDINEKSKQPGFFAKLCKKSPSKISQETVTRNTTLKFSGEKAELKIDQEKGVISKNSPERYLEKDHPEELNENNDFSQNLSPEKIKLKKKFKSEKIEIGIKEQENDQNNINLKSNISLDIRNESSNKGNLTKKIPGSPKRVALKDSSMRQSGLNLSDAIRINVIEVASKKEINVMEDLKRAETSKNAEANLVKR